MQLALAAHDALCAMPVLTAEVLPLAASEPLQHQVRPRSLTHAHTLTGYRRRARLCSVATFMAPQQQQQWLWLIFCAEGQQCQLPELGASFGALPSQQLYCETSITFRRDLRKFTRPVSAAARQRWVLATI